MYGCICLPTRDSLAVVVTRGAAIEGPLPDEIGIDKRIEIRLQSSMSYLCLEIDIRIDWPDG